VKRWPSLVDGEREKDVNRAWLYKVGRNIAVNAPAYQLPHVWAMPATAKKLDMTAYIQRHTTP
jgi:hypothetical protein